MIWTLIVLGATPAALSAAFEARRAGLTDILVLAESGDALPTVVSGVSGLRVQTGTRVVSVEERPDDVIIESDAESFRALFCVDGRRIDELDPHTPVPVAASVADRVHSAVGEVRDHDVLIVGDGEAAVADAVRAETGGARVVLSFTGEIDRLTRLSQMTLTRMEQAGRLTVLWRSAPTSVDDVGGSPMAFFADHRTPDLSFDDVVFAADLSGEHVEGSGRRLRPRTRRHPAPPCLVAHRRAPRRRARRASIRSSTLASSSGIHEIRDLRREHYNATITFFDHSHHDLWVLRIRPDNLQAGFRPGQYATLGLGYWEPRVDDADEGLTPERRRSLIRRSYSISSRIFDDHGYLVDPARDGGDRALHRPRPARRRRGSPPSRPRLADKRAGDRDLPRPEDCRSLHPRSR